LPAQILPSAYENPSFHKLLSIVKSSQVCFVINNFIVTQTKVGIGRQVAKVFISYSRIDIEFAKRLTGELQKSDLDFWIDWDGIPLTVDWWREIEKGIEESDAFLFLISPDSAKSKVCGQEIEHAVRNGKRLIPLVVRDTKGDDVHPKLLPLNWIFFRETEDFDASINKLLTSIHTDFEWVETQRRLQVKALEWERKNNENSFLLRGKDLGDAELQLAANSSKEPFPTDLQRDYVFESRKAVDKQTRITVGISIIGILITTALAIFGFLQARLATANANAAQKNEATAQSASTLAFDNAATAVANEKEAIKQSEISRAGELAAQAVLVRDKSFDLSMLLSVEALRVANTSRTESVLLDSVQTNPYLFQYVFGHTGRILTFEFSPDGKLLAYSDSSGVVVLWDIDAAKELEKRLVDDAAPITKLAFTPNGKLLVVGNSTGNIRVWDLETYLPVGQPLVQKSGVVSLAVNQKGDMMASSDEAGKIYIWNLETYQLLTELSSREIFRVLGLAFSPDGKTFAAAGEGVNIVLWDLDSFTQIGLPLSKHQDYIHYLTFSHDGKTLASSSEDGTIILWSMDNYQPIGQPLSGGGGFNLAYTSDNSYLVSAAVNGDIVYWCMCQGSPDIRRRYPINPNTGLTNYSESIAMNADKGIYAVGNIDGSVTLWSIKKNSYTRQTLPQKSNWSLSAISADGQIMAVVNANDNTDNGINITLRNVQTLSNLGLSTLDNIGVITSMAFSPNGKIIVLGGKDGKLIFLDVQTLNLVDSPVYIRPESEIGILAFSQDSKLLAVGSADGNVRLWDLSKHELMVAPFKAISSVWVNGLAFSPDERFLVSGTNEKTIVKWDVATGRVLRIDPPIGFNQTGRIAFDSSGGMMAFGSYGSEGLAVFFWDMNKRKLVGQPLKGFSGYIQDLVFDDDQALIITANYGGFITLWDTRNHQQIGQAINIDDSSLPTTIRDLVFSSDHNELIIAADNLAENMIVTLDVSHQVWLEKTCQRVGRNFTRAEWAQYFPDDEYRATCPQWQLEPEISPIQTPAIEP
jgi:WD40 repeat protein